MITLRHTTHGSTPLDEWSDRRRGLYLKTHNIQKRQTCMTPEGFEPTIPVSERSQNHALNGTATGIDILQWLWLDKSIGEFLKGEYKTRYSARCEKNCRSGRVKILADAMGLCVARYRWDHFLSVNEETVCVTQRCFLVHSLCKCVCFEGVLWPLNSRA